MPDIPGAAKEARRGFIGSKLSMCKNTQLPMQYNRINYKRFCGEMTEAKVPISIPDTHNKSTG